MTQGSQFVFDEFTDSILGAYLIAELALVGLLVSMNEHVRLQVTLRRRGIGTQVTLEAFLSVMSLAVHLKGISVRKCFLTSFTLQRSFGSMELLNMNPEVRLSPASCWTELTLKDRLVPSVNQSMGFQTVRLCKASLADVTFVGLLSGVDSEMSF